MVRIVFHQSHPASRPGRFPHTPRGIGILVALLVLAPLLLAGLFVFCILLLGAAALTALAAGTMAIKRRWRQWRAPRPDDGRWNVRVVQGGGSEAGCGNPRDNVL